MNVQFFEHQYNTAALPPPADLVYKMAIAYIILKFSIFVFLEFLFGYPHSNSLKLDLAIQLLAEIPEMSAKGEERNDVFVSETWDGTDLPAGEIDPYSTSKLKLLTNEYLRLLEKWMLYVTEQKVYLNLEFSIVSLSDYTYIPFIIAFKLATDPTPSHNIKAKI